MMLMSANSRLPEKVDWRIMGAVTSVKDQVFLEKKFFFFLK